MISNRWLAVAALTTLVALPGCDGVNIDEGVTAGQVYCQDMGAQYHFEVLVPPWKYSKEYRCTDWQDLNCVGTWTATGRYVFVVSDVPFINFDSEIITSLDVEITNGDTASLVQQLIASENVGGAGSTATFVGDAADYPKVVEPKSEEALGGHELLWRQERTFQGKSFNWYRRDVFLEGAAGKRYHLRFFSIDRLDREEFDSILETFREGPAPDGAPDCTCRDEHDPSGTQEC